MAQRKFLKGSALFALARKKAAGLGLDSKNCKLEDLIHRIQDQEGHSACFRKKSECPELSCCWQASCSASMRKEKTP